MPEGSNRTRNIPVNAPSRRGRLQLQGGIERTNPPKRSHELKRGRTKIGRAIKKVVRRIRGTKQE